MKNHRLNLILLTALPVVGLMVSSNSRAQQGGYYHGHMWDGGWHGWFFGPLMGILLIALIVIVVVLMVRQDDGQAGSEKSRRNETPLEILEKRFARGEIDKEEFEERRRVLEK